MDNGEAALTEPLGCVVHASEMVARSRTRYVIGAQQSDRSVQSILIFGAGPAGLLFTQYLRNVLGYDGLLLVSEPNASKRELAARYGAEVIVEAILDRVLPSEGKYGKRFFGSYTIIK